MLKDKDAKQSIKVAIRIRPISQKQSKEEPKICIKVQKNNSLLVTSNTDVRNFTFDSIFQNYSQQQIFERIGRKCILDCLQGYNCTIFAYGQTGAGKTYTMMGSNYDKEDYQLNKGLIPRSMQLLFHLIQKEKEKGINFICRCSFLEIYNQQIIDLLNKSNYNLQLRQDTKKGVYVQGITQENITICQQAIQILQKGSKSRHVGSTTYNDLSSRSHSVFTLQIESKYIQNGVINTKSRQLNFIDLAGSQRTKQSTGQRLKQGCNINKSLMNLASVINSLSQISQTKSAHANYVNYRNSKLTFLLKDSLGGNSKTTLIANLNPGSIFYHETISTLGFARRVKLIKCDKAQINEDSIGNIQSMKNEIKRLKRQIINLMNRQQLDCKNKDISNIIYEYCSQQIQKQGRLQIQMIKLNDRISYLEKGIQQYNNNEIHLRMIIDIYEDKLNRMNKLQKYLENRIQNMTIDDNILLEYINNERQIYINKLNKIRQQYKDNTYIYQLLKLSKIIRYNKQQQQQNIKDLLIKNNNYLNIIYNKLQQNKQQKQNNINLQQYQNKIKQINNYFILRQLQYQQRIDQINLQFNQYKNINQQYQILFNKLTNQYNILQQQLSTIKNKNILLIQQIQSILKNQQIIKRQLNYKSLLLKQKQLQNIKLQSYLHQINNQSTSIFNQNNILISEISNIKSNYSQIENNYLSTIQSLKKSIQNYIIQRQSIQLQFKNQLQSKQLQINQLVQQIQAIKQTKNEFQMQLQLKKIQCLKQQQHNLAKMNELQSYIIIQRQRRQKEAKSQCDTQQLICRYERKLDQLRQLLSTQQNKSTQLTSQYNIRQQQYKQLIKQYQNKQLIYNNLSQNIINLQQKLSITQLQNNKLNICIKQYQLQLNQFIESKKQTQVLLQSTHNSLSQQIQLNKQLNYKIKSIQTQNINLLKTNNQLSIKLSALQQKQKYYLHLHEQINKQISSIKTQSSQLQNINHKITSQNQLLKINLQQSMFFQDQNNNNKQLISKLKIQLSNYQQKYKKQKQLQQNRQLQLCQQKQSNKYIKQLLQNKTRQYQQLQIQLQQNRLSYNRLLSKISKYQNNQQQQSNQINTIQLLQKTRLQQIQLRKQYQSSQIIITNLQSIIQQKQLYIKQIQSKSQKYCTTIHNKLQDLQYRYEQLQSNYIKLKKQKKLSQNNYILKDEINNLKVNSAKIALQNEQIQAKIKKANLNSIKLQRQYQQVKRSQSIIVKRSQSIISNNLQQKTIYINKLKAQIASLRTQKILLNQSLNKQRDQKNKLKLEIKYNKQINYNLSNKIQLDKKINQNQNLIDLIYQIINHLQLNIHQPKNKIQIIRSHIINTIKQKNNQIQTLKQRLKYQQEIQYHKRSKIDSNIKRQILQHKNFNTSYQSFKNQQIKFKYINNPISHQNNLHSHSKSKQFENYYSKYKNNSIQNKQKPI